MRTNPCVLVITLLLGLAVSAPVWAQEDTGDMGFGGATPEGEAVPEDGEPPVEEVEAKPPSEEEAFLAGEQTEDEKLLAAPEEEKGTGLAEDPKTPYFGVGPRLRWIMVPSWFVGMFGVDMKSNSHLLINNIAAGAEFTYRKDGFDVTASVWYVGLNWNGYVSFKGNDEDANSWEVVENNLRGLMITVDFIWSTSLTDWFAITYGAGLGLGIPFGDIIRTEATSSSNHTRPCQGPSDTDPDCHAREEYGEIYEIPTRIIPWINFLFGMRFKVHRHVALYTDFGFGLGFQAGVRGVFIF